MVTVERTGGERHAYWSDASSEYIVYMRTQTRPAIEYVSGEEGLRPKSYEIRHFFLCVHLQGRPEVHSDPWLLSWSRGEMTARVLPSEAQCVACQFPLFIMFVTRWRLMEQPQDHPLVVDSPAALAFNKAGVPAGARPLSFNNLPRGQRLWQPGLLTASFVVVRRLVEVGCV